MTGTGPVASRAFVDELLDDARLIARYRRWINDDEADLLLAAIDKADGAESRALGDPAVIELNRLVKESGRVVPFRVLSALRRGWDPHQPTRGSRWGTGLLIALTLLLAIYAGTCTFIYNNGVAALHELDALIAMDVRKSFSRLLRDMDQAQGQAEDAIAPLDGQPTDAALPSERLAGVTPASPTAASVEPATQAAGPPADAASGTSQATSLDRRFSRPAQFDLARNVYFDSESELVQLSQRLTRAQQDSDGVTSQLGRAFPWGGILRCAYFRWVRADDLLLVAGTPGNHLSYVAGQADTFCGPGTGYALLARSGLVGPSATTAGSTSAPAAGPVAEADPAAAAPVGPSEAGAAAEGGVAELPPYPGVDARCASFAVAQGSGDGPSIRTFEGYVDRLGGLWTTLFCRGILTFSPASFPAVASDRSELRLAMTPFAVLILPALYGAVGALMTLMRTAVVPLLPNPGVGTILHRASFGAIAGVVLVWFVTPESLFQSQMSALGLSLFGFAFLVGFSLDLFFSLFDRLVSLASSGVQSWGEESVQRVR